MKYSVRSNMECLNKILFVIASRIQRHSISPRLIQNDIKNCVSYFSTPHRQNMTESHTKKLRRPKKPATPFIRFLQCSRSKISEEHPNLSSKEVVKYAAEIWKNADENTKTKFQVEYLTENEKYQADILKYNCNLAEEDRVIAKQNEMKLKESKYQNRIQSKLKCVEKPKRPMNAFVLFLVSKQSELQCLNAQDYCREIAEQWKSLSAKKKLKFYAQSKKLREEYSEKLAEWKKDAARNNEAPLTRGGNIDTTNKCSNNDLSSDSKTLLLKFKKRES